MVEFLNVLSDMARLPSNVHQFINEFGRVGSFRCSVYVHKSDLWRLQFGSFRCSENAFVNSQLKNKMMTLKSTPTVGYNSIESVTSVVLERSFT